MIRHPPGDMSWDHTDQKSICRELSRSWSGNILSPPWTINRSGRDTWSLRWVLICSRSRIACCSRDLSVYVLQSGICNARTSGSEAPICSLHTPGDDFRSRFLSNNKQGWTHNEHGGMVKKLPAGCVDRFVKTFSTRKKKWAARRLRFLPFFLDVEKIG